MSCFLNGESRLYKCGYAHVDAAKVAGEVAKAAGKVAKVTKVAIHDLHARDEACPRGIAPLTARSDRSSHRQWMRDQV